MQIARKDFLNLSVFMNFNFSEPTNKELFKNNMFTIKEVYAGKHKLTDKAKTEINKVFTQYEQEII